MERHAALHGVAPAFFVGGQLVLVVAIVPALRGRLHASLAFVWFGVGLTHG